MSWIYRLITAHNSLTHAQTRKFGEEVKEAFRLLEDLQEQRALAQNQGDTISILNSFVGVNSATFAYPMFINPSDDLFPNGFPVQFTGAVRIKRCFLQADPSVTASAATTFTLQNAASSPTSSGQVTIASGASFGSSTSLNVLISLGQRLHIRAPSALNSIQNIYVAKIEWEPA